MSGKGRRLEPRTLSVQPRGGTMAPIVLFIGLGLLAWIWLLSRLRICILLDPRGLLTLILVICALTIMVGVLILEGIRAALGFMAGNPAVPALIVIVPLAGAMLLRRSRSGTGFPF